MAIIKMFDSEHQLKPCSVKIEKMSVEDGDTDSSSFDDDIPFLPNISNFDLSPHASKSVDELVSDSVNLAKKILQTSRSQENLKTCVKPADQQAGSIKSAIDDINLSKEEEFFPPEITFFKLFCEKSSMVFFNRNDVTPFKCGYIESHKLTAFEKLLVSLKPVEFENMLSFSLSFYPTNHITDCKSFISYLLRMISVIEDKDSVDACNYALQTLLTEHPSVHDVSFSTSELFMFLFNYGVDVNKCDLLELMPELREELTSKKSSDYYSNKIPDQWWYNLKATLTILLNLICFCSFNHNELFSILLFLLWLSMEETLINKGIDRLVFNCIEVTLESFSEDIWPDACRHLTEKLLEVKNLNIIYFMASRIPFTSERGIKIRKCICFKALKKFCSEHSSVLEEAEEFNISSLKLLLETAVFTILPKFSSCDSLCLFINFFDICVNHMEFKSKVEKAEFCSFLKFCENSIKQNDTPAKSHLLRISSRLTLGISVDSINVCYIKKEYEDNTPFCHISLDRSMSDQVSGQSPSPDSEKSDAIPKCLSAVSEISTDFALNENSETEIANFSDVIIPSTSGILSSSKDFSNVPHIIRETGSSDLPVTFSVNSIINEDSKIQDADSGSKHILPTAVFAVKKEFFADCNSDSSAPVHSSPVVDSADISQLSKKENCSSTSSFPAITAKTFFENHEAANLGLEYCYEQQYDLDGNSLTEPCCSDKIEKHSEQSLDRNALNSEVLNFSTTKDAFVQNSLDENNAISDKENSGDVQNILQEYVCASDIDVENKQLSSSDVCYQESTNKSIFPEKISHSVRENELAPALISSSSNSSTETGTILDKQFIKAGASDVVPIKTVINRFKSKSFNNKQQSNRNNLNECVYTVSDSSSEESDVEFISCNMQAKPVINIPLKKGESTPHPLVVNVKTAQSIKRPNSDEDFSRKKKKNSTNMLNSKSKHQTAFSGDKNINSRATNSQQKCVESSKECYDNSNVIVLDSDNDDCSIVCDNDDCTIVYLKNNIITID